MSFFVSGTNRRRLFAAAICAFSLSLVPARAEKAGSGNFPVAELMAPNALPDIAEGKADAPVTIIEFAEDHGIKIGIENCPMFFTKDEWPGGKNLMTTPVIWRRASTAPSSGNNK